MMRKSGREEIVETLMMEVANPKLFLDDSSLGWHVGAGINLEPRPRILARDRVDE
jgi:hypothetical protein